MGAWITLIGLWVLMPPEEPPLDPAGGDAADRFAQLAVESYDTSGVEDTVQAVVQFALHALNCSHAGVALTVHGRPEIPAVTDPVVAEIYQLQTDSGDGPLLESMRDHDTLRIRDTATEPRWPDWAAKVLAVGIRSVLDVPLTTATGTVGVLGLYSTEPDAFGSDDEAIAHILARHASVAVASARHEETLAQAIDARLSVGQAMGILMERLTSAPTARSPSSGAIPKTPTPSCATSPSSSSTPRTPALTAEESAGHRWREPPVTRVAAGSRFPVFRPAAPGSPRPGVYRSSCRSSSSLSRCSAAELNRLAVVWEMVRPVIGALGRLRLSSPRAVCGRR